MWTGRPLRVLEELCRARGVGRTQDELRFLLGIEEPAPILHLLKSKSQARMGDGMRPGPRGEAPTIAWIITEPGALAFKKLRSRLSR